jgi:hypothetical protein
LGSWIRIRIKEKSRELWRHTKVPWRLILEPWRLTIDPMRLTVELWNVIRPEVANSHHFDEDPDSDLQPIERSDPDPY